MNYLYLTCGLLVLSVNMYTCTFQGSMVCDMICNVTNTVLCSRIPDNIPLGTKIVILESIHGDQRETGNTATLENGTFAGDNWESVKYLQINDIYFNTDLHTVEFNSGCFTGLGVIEEIRINITANMHFKPSSFTELDNLITLDVTGCERLNTANLFASLIGTENVPNLEKLIISNLKRTSTQIDLSEHVWKTIASKNIKYIDFSTTVIARLEMDAFLKYCGQFEYVNISRVDIKMFIRSTTIRGHCEHLRVLDVRYSHSNHVSPFCYGHVSVRDISYDMGMDMDYLSPFTNLESVYASMCYAGSSIKFSNVTVTLESNHHWRLNSVLISDMNLPLLDIKLHTNCSLGIVNITIPNNNIEFISPGFFSGMLQLERVDLSSNRLHKMAASNTTLFSAMFKSLKLLKYTSLSSNELPELPEDMFIQNTLLEVIDLSSNRLTQVTLKLTVCIELKLLILNNNLIRCLDSASIAVLNSIGITHNNSNGVVSHIDLRFNPLVCARCEHFDFINWLTESPHVDLRNHPMQCTDTDNDKQTIGPTVVQTLQELCDRPLVVNRSIILVTTLIGAMAILFTASIYGIKKCRRILRSKRNMEERIRLIQEGEDQYQFVVFLSYCEEDSDFVNSYVYDSLLQLLRDKTETNRDLISTGDKYFQLGRYIHNESTELLQKSSVVLVVVSDSFCSSQYCQTEFNIACRLSKPIVLMFKDTVNEDLMLPAMKELFKKHTRILWTHEHGEYQLKSTWENVATSILELVE